MTAARGGALFRWCVRRVGGTALVLLGTSALLFAIVSASPRETYSRSFVPTSEAERLDAPSLGWGAPYRTWLAGALRGNFGVSSALRRGSPVEDLLWPAARRSFSLGAAALTFSATLALALAWVNQARPAGRLGALCEHVLVLASATPVFLLAYALVAGGNHALAWGIEHAWWSAPPWFPLPSKEAWLPWLLAAGVLALGDGFLLDLYQQFRAELEHAATAEYLVGARMLGLSVPWLIARAFLPGAAAHLARRLSFLLGSLVVLEAALGWPGLGQLAWRAAAERDTPVLLAVALVLALVVRAGVLTGDAVFYGADPRSRGS